MRPGAFTLIEVMAVVAVIGLLAGATVWSMAETATRGSLNAAVGSVAHADRTARLAAERSGRPLVLRYDLEDGTIVRITRRDGETLRSHRLRLPSRWQPAEIACVVQTTDEAGLSRTDYVRQDAGVVEIAFSPAGRSGGYGLKLAGPEGRGRWLFFAGLTGQLTIIDHDQEMDNLLESLLLAGPDAD